MATDNSGDYDKEMGKIRSKYNEIQTILNTNDKSNEKEPYANMYCAIKKFMEMFETLYFIKRNIPCEMDHIDSMCGIVHFNLGVLFTETEETKAGEEQFISVLKVLEGKEFSGRNIITVISTLNQLGLIWSQWDEPLKAKDFLLRAEQLYKDYIAAENAYHDIKNMSDVFGVNNKSEVPAENVVNKLHTLTSYYLAQVYSVLKDHHTSAKYCHMTLRRQLTEDNLDYIEWALNAATLSQYFMENKYYTQARHHLSAASYMLQKYEIILQTKDIGGIEEAIAAEWERFKHRKADVARCWAKYGIILLSMSKERLLEKVNDEKETNEEESSNKSNLKPDEIADIGNLRFELLEKETETIEAQVTDKFLLDFNDAKHVFLNCQKWLEEAKSYYSFDSHASDYVQIAQDLSQAYKHLSFFEEKDDSRAKMHKRRINILENIVNELNPQYYQSVCRQLWLELGEVYSDILEIKFDRLTSIDERPSGSVLAKINNLIKSSITNYQNFLDSIKAQTSSALPEIPEEFLHSALWSYFQIGRLSNKFIITDRKMQAENLQKSIDCFNYVISYCEKYPKAVEVSKEVLGLSQDLLILLTQKRDLLKLELKRTN